MNKLAMKLATSAVAFATMFVVSIPVFAAVAIDYDKEQITGLAATQEYSLDQVKWNDVYSNGTDVSPIDLKPLIKNTGTITVYYRTQDTVDAEISTVTVPSRPAAPQGIKFMPKETTVLDVINTADSQEVKYGYSSWVTSPGDGTLVGNFEKNGAKLTVRTKAVTGTSFVSSPVTVNVPKQRPKPATAVYKIAEDAVPVAKGMEYKIEARAETTPPTTPTLTSDSGWKAVEATQKSITRKDINETAGITAGATASVFVRLAATPTLAASAYSTVKIPASVTAPALPELTMVTEKLTKVSTTMEYRVLTEKTALTATHSTPKWTAITGSSQDIAKLISTSTSKTPNTRIQVRTKAVPAVGTIAEKPASAVKEFKLTKRPATPKVTEFTVNYDPTSPKLVIPVTHQYQFETDATWSNGGEISITSKIPVTGAKPFKFYVRVAPIEAGDSGTDEPASIAFKGGKINPVPAAPKTPAFSKTTKKITGVTSKMEYIIGSGTSWESVVGTAIDLSGQAEGSSGTVKVRLKNTASAPASGEKSVSFTMPTKK